MDNSTNPIANPFEILLEKLSIIEAQNSKLIELLEKPQSDDKPRFINMKEAEIVAGKSANALRVQISLGNLKSIKKGSRHYFDREYLENWISGGLNEKGATS